MIVLAPTDSLSVCLSGVSWLHCVIAAVCLSVCHIGSNLSGVYRMQLAPGHYVFVQTKSKLFKNSASGHPEFIMSTHSIVRSVVTDNGDS